jgi:hypothetical protein
VLLERFGLQPLAARRFKRQVLFIHRVVNNHIVCSDILVQVNFHIPPRSRYTSSLSYVTPRIIIYRLTTQV